MTIFKLIVFSDAKRGREKEYNDWYNDFHLDDALTLPGFKSAQRFQTHNMGKDAPCRFAALYDIEADTVEDAIASALSAEKFETSDALDATTAYAIPLIPITAVRTRAGAAAAAVQE